MRMTNKDLIKHCNELNDLLQKEEEQGTSSFSGLALLTITRNFRKLIDEYSSNYEKDFARFKKRFYKDDGETLLDDVTAEEANNELSELLEYEVDVPIVMLKPSDVESVHSVTSILALDFMIL